jgi:hypothetical protein
MKHITVRCDEVGTASSESSRHWPREVLARQSGGEWGQVEETQSIRPARLLWWLSDERIVTNLSLNYFIFCSPNHHLRLPLLNQPSRRRTNIAPLVAPRTTHHAPRTIFAMSQTTLEGRCNCGAIVVRLPRPERISLCREYYSIGRIPRFPLPSPLSALSCRTQLTVCNE